TNNFNGTVTYTPNPGFSGTDTFQYTVQDDDGATSNTATATITVTAANVLPVANDDSATTSEDTAVTIAVLDNDTDSDGTLDASTVAIATAPSNGSAIANADGTIAYTPNANVNGTDTFTYTVADNVGGVSNTATVTVTITAVNDAPVALADLSSTTLDTPVTINVLANDTDVDGTLDVATVSVVSAPSSGAAIVNADGTIQYAPTQGFLGTDTFQYTVNDDSGATSNSATVTVTVNPDNATPIAIDDAATTDEDTAIAITVLANDTDDGPLDVSSVQIVQDPTAGTATVGTDGVVTYTPNPNVNGTDTFTYTVADTEGARSAAATVTVTVDPVNDAPVAVADVARTDEDTTVQIDVLANDTDVDGDVLTVASFTAASLGQVARGDDGQLIYTPNANVNGTDTFTYTTRDATGATSDPAAVTITITSVNDAPVAQNDAAVTDEDTAVLIDIRANDTDADDALTDLTITLQTAPTNGQVLVDQDAGTVRYTPNAAFTGDDSFRYLLRDPNGGVSNVATVRITVRSVIVGNTPPVAVNDEAETLEGSAVVISVLANDSDQDGTLDANTVAIAADAANGTTAVSEGAVTYTPNAGFSGTDTFQYTVRDDDGAVSNAATVTVTVNALVIAAPVANDDEATTEEDTAVQIAVLANDTTEGTLDAGQVLIGTAPSLGSALVDAQGVVTYTPSPNVSGTDTFTYTVADTDGRRSNSATVTITIAPVNDVPIAQDDTAATDEDTALLIVFADLLANDTDIDGDALSVSAVGEAAQGTTTLESDGIRYVPNADANGTDTFSYTVNDGNGSFDTATVTLSIAPVNDAPVAQDDTATTEEDTAVEIDVLANDADVDGDTLTLALLTTPANGTAEVAEQRIVYTPAANFAGLDTFTYRITDPDGLSSEATVSVAVGNSADAPVANDDEATTEEDTAVQIDVLANDTDPDGDALLIQSATTPTLGTVAIAADAQTLTYTPNPDVSGTDTFSYTVSDGNDGFDTATVTVTIRPVNDAPVAVDDEAQTSAFTPVVIDVLANDTDPEGDALSLVAASASRQGGTTQVVDDQVRYVPPPNFEGTDGFTYTIADEAGASAEAQVTVTVGPLRYRVVEVGTLGGVSRAMDVNAEGHIVGISTDAEGRIQPFFFDGREIKPVRTPEGRPGHAYALNDAGDMVGFALVNETEGYATQGTASGLEALGGFDGGAFSTAYDINNAGTVVGTAQADAQYRAVVWGAPTIIGPDTPGTEAFGVNDEGLAVGVASLGDGRTEAFAGESLLPGDGNGRAYAVNNAGTVVGSLERDGTFTAVAWLEGEPIEVAAGGEAYAINDAGWIVGTHTPTAQASKTASPLPAALLTITERRGAVASKAGTQVGSSGFISIDGTLRDLTGSIDSTTGWQITEARGINATGEIAAVGVRDGSVQALLLLPTSNLAPAAREDRATLAAGETLLLDVLANDADPDGDALVLMTVNAATHGEVVQLGDTQIRYTPPAGFHGLDTFTYVVGDGRGGTAVAEVAITVEPPLDFAGEVELGPAYPNPFNPTTALTIRAKADSEVQLDVYDALGRHVRTVFAGPVARGQHTFTFSADGLASGLYLVRLVAQGRAQTQRLMLLK
ncbi:MAG: Ig-like domain-containing protein, partial [Bacteroidota bacterium]